jgi:beta-galactosidase
MPTVVDEPMVEQLADFVRGGGRLIAECAPGEYTSLGWRRPVVPGLVLADIFGAHEIETDAVGEVAVAMVGGASLVGAWQRESLRLDTASAIGHFPDGSVAACEAVYGAGTAVLIATYPSVAYARRPDAATRSAIESMLAPANSSPWASWAAPGPGLISRQLVLADGRHAVIAVNWTGSDQQLRATSGTESLYVQARTGRLLVLDS